MERYIRRMLIFHLTFCALLINQPTDVMLFNSHEEGQSERSTKKSPDLVDVTPVRIRRELSSRQEEMTARTTQESPTTEGGMHVDVRRESPTTEGGVHVDVSRESPTTKGGMHVDVTQESPTTEGGMHVGVTQKWPTAEGGRLAASLQEPPSQEKTLRGISTNSSETSFSSDVTLTPYRWLCAKLGYRQLSIKVHCNCDPLCVLYGDCCYGVTENATECAASVRLTSAQGTSLRETHSNSTTSTAAPNNTSSWIRELNQLDPASISLAQKSSCRKPPTFRRQKSQRGSGEMDIMGLSFWMVDKCPPSWMEEESRIKCTDTPNTGITENALLYQPVTDPDRMITFRNKYCAVCNGIKNGGEPWGLVVYDKKAEINEFVNCSSSVCVLRKLKYFGSHGIFVPKPEWNLRTCFREAEDDAFGPCKFNFINGSVRRMPRPLPLHSALRDACMAYNNPVVLSGFDESYKNYHCVVCYGGDLTVCGVENATSPEKGFGEFSFRALLYLGDQDRKQSDDEMIRSLDQQIMCPPGFVPDDQGCRALMYNFTVVKSIVPLHFEPCGWASTPRDDCMDIRRNGQLRDVLKAVQADIRSCSEKHGADDTSITFVVETMVTLRVRLAHYQESRNILNQVKARMENALQKVQFEISGGPIGIRLGSFSACKKNATHHGSVPPFSGKTPNTTPKQSRGNIHIGNVRLFMLMVMVAAVWDFYM